MKNIVLAFLVVFISTSVSAKDYLSREPKIVRESEIDTQAEAVEGGEEETQIIRILLGTEDTAGQFSMFSDTFTEADASVAPHKHEWHDEAFYVTRGRYEVSNGDLDVWEEVSEGDAVYTPRDTPHSWRSLEADSKFVVFYTPGGWEKFYYSVIELTDEQRADPEFMENFMRSYDEILLEPENPQ